MFISGSKTYANKLLSSAAKNNQQLNVLDLGCGTAAHFVKLLRTYPNIKYTGIDPDRHAISTAKKLLPAYDTKVHIGPAYNIASDMKEQFDLVVSISTLEHVYHRDKYIESISNCLKSDAWAFISYDYGHFVNPQNWKERVKNRFGWIPAFFGGERYYQSFVNDSDFIKLVQQYKLKICERKAFNIHIKTSVDFQSDNELAAWSNKWTDLELEINEIMPNLTDKYARWFYTAAYI